MPGLPPITNFVVLMLENRSFDNVLGMLYPYSANFEGLQGNEFNLDSSGNKITIANNPTTTLMPPADPGESFEDMNLQIWGNTSGTGSQSLSGFVLDYMAAAGQYPDIKTSPHIAYPALPRANAGSAQDIMNYFTTAGANPQLPVTSALAQAFAISDSWFGSCPTQTYPNRMFLHSATAGGYVDDFQYILNVSVPNFGSTFQLLDAGKTPSPANWKIYFHDAPLASLLNYYSYQADKNNPGLICNFDNNSIGPTITPTFLDDVAAGTLPRYSFIEPRYKNYPAPLNLMENDNHPPSDMIFGEILLANVYNAIRKSAYWTNKNIMLIVIYDEHGGCYDHVVPPAAVAPGGPTLPPVAWTPPYKPFPTQLFGPRVPAIIISPWVVSSSQSQSAFRPPNFIPNKPSTGTPFDHTSVISTLNLFFNIGTLTARDAAAPPLGPNIANLYGDGSNAGPASVPVPTAPATMVAKQLAQPSTALGRLHNLLDPPQ
ncbi:MAG: alkaline phosphatase family protein [Candidatus Sulfotelmatobacter sp.]